MVGECVLEPFPKSRDFFRLNLDVRRLSPARITRGGLVNQDAGVGQSQSLARRSTREQNRGGRGRLSQNDGLNLGADVLQGSCDSRTNSCAMTSSADASST